MIYDKWNSILCSYFFSNSNAMTFLSIDKETLIDLALKSNDFAPQLANIKNKFKTSDDIRCYIWNDFINIFKSKESTMWIPSKSSLLKLFQSKISDSAFNISIPHVFPFIALFIIPLSNVPELKANAFYPRIKSFLQENNLISEKEDISTLDMAGLVPGLDFMWNNISEWAAANGYLFNVSFRNSSGRVKYAAPFLCQLIFTASQRDNFKLMFYNAGLIPSQEVNEETAIKIFAKYYTLLGISKNRWEVIRKDYLPTALSVFNQELENWDGMAIVKKKEDNYCQAEYLGVSQNLLLVITLFRGTFHFGLKAQLLDADFGEEFSYESHFCGTYNFSTDNYGMAEQSIWNKEIEDSISNKRSVVFTKSGDNNIKLSYIPSDIELLEYSFGAYVSCKKLQKGRKYLILVRNSILDYYTQWLKDNSATQLSPNILSTTHSLFLINSACSEFGLSNVKRLNFDVRKSINLVDTLVLGKSNDIIILYSGLPIYYKITGIDVKTDIIRAVFNSGGKVDSINLTYNDEADVWTLAKVSNIFLQHKQFQIYCNESILSSTKYKLSDFTIIQPYEYEEIKFNKYGESDDNGEFNGLKLEGKDHTNWSSLQKKMDEKRKKIPLSENNYTDTDYILYYLSVRPRYERDSLKKAIDVLIRNGIYTYDINKKWWIKNIIDNYFRLGYINYAYIDGKHILAVNQPSILLLLPKFTRRKISETNMISIDMEESFWTGILTGARTPNTIKVLLNFAQSFSYNGERVYIEIKSSIDNLLPQTIYLRAYSISALEKFAEQLGYTFQKCIYSKTMFDGIASVEEYISHVTNCESFDRYDGISNFERIDFTQIALNGKYCKLHDFSTDSSVVTYFPGTYREQCIFWKEGKQYQVDKHWGHLIGMKIENAKIIKCDLEKGILQLPIMIQLPQLYARALTMISGKIPVEDGYIRTYDIYDNPYVSVVSMKSILYKLSQM